MLSAKNACHTLIPRYGDIVGYMLGTIKNSDLSLQVLDPAASFTPKLIGFNDYVGISVVDITQTAKLRFK
jgi:hypothetical protein